MNFQGGHNTQLSPDAALTEIDAALYESFEREDNPSYVKASDELFFQQGPTSGVGFIWDEDSNVGEFEATDEQEEISTTDSWVGNQKTVLSQKWTKRVPISDEAFRADMIGKRQQIGKNVGERARMTQDKKALLNTYGDAFAGSVATTPDGQSLASNSHVTLKGHSVDNLETGSGTPDNLWTLVGSLARQKGQDGDAGGYLMAGLLTNFALYKTFKEILNSELVANSGENNLNVFMTDYGTVRLGASIFLDSTYNSATNAATSYHIVSRNHMVQRKVFYGLTTYMTEPQNTDNDSYVLTAKYHEVAFPGSWSGYAGSNGTV